MIINDPFSLERSELKDYGFTLTTDIKHFSHIKSTFITHYYFFTENNIISTYMHMNNDFVIFLDGPLKPQYTTRFQAYVQLDDIIKIYDKYHRLTWNYQYNIPCDIDIKKTFPELISRMESAIYLYKLCKG